MKRFLLGSILGAAASSLRARAGMTLFEFPAPSALSIYGVRALALVSCAVALFHARALFHDRKQNTLLLLGLTLGFLAHGLFLLPFQGSAQPVMLGLLAIAAPLLARLLRRGSHSPVPDEKSLGTIPLIGLAVCAAGAALAMEGSARQLRLLGAGTDLDDTLFGGVFLALATFGGLAFARTLAQFRRDWGRGRAVETGLVLTALLTLVSQRTLVAIASGPGLRHFMRRYGQDTFEYGMFGYDAILATAVWIAPAFALGTAIGCARHASELVALAGGAALGHLLLLTAEGTTNVSLLQQGIWIAAGGGLLAAFLRPKRADGLPLAVALLALIAGIVTPMVTTVQNTTIADIWKRYTVAPDLAIDTPAGSITVTAGGADVDVVALNGVNLTPNLAQAGGDRNDIVTSVHLLDPMQRAQGFHVLLIGQLTPGRALALTQLGAVRIDRTAAWHASMPRLEQRLFGGRGHSLPDGDVLAPRAAREQFASYDLVLALATKGQAPVLPTDFDLEQDESPLVVLWIDGARGVHRRRLDAPLLLSTDGVEQLTMAVVRPASRHASVAANGLVSFFEPATATDRITAWRDALVRAPRRHELGLMRFMTALAEANAGTRTGNVARGLAMHYGAQRRSSIFESAMLQIEISEGALQKLSEALDSPPAPDSLEREVWNGIGRVLLEKRNIPAIYRYLEPLAKRWAPWPELQLALARADLESLEPADALERLAGLEADTSGITTDVLEVAARARAQTGDHEGAVETLRRLGELDPSPWQRRLLGIEATLAGDPEGPTILAEILGESPDDEEVRALLEEGVAPSAPGQGTQGHLNHDH